MISVETAYHKVLESALHFETEKVDINDSLGRILANPILASRNYPPFNRVAMDGIGLDYSSYEQGNRVFKKQGIQAAGSAQLTLESQDNCVETMTGAILPKGCTTVIPYELLLEDNENFTVPENIKNASNIHKQASDLIKGNIVLGAPSLINSTTISLLATEGAETIEVLKNPSVAIVSTGDELVEISETPLPFQIRKSNSVMLKAELKKWKINANNFHLKDEKEQLKNKISKILDSHDVLLLSGGVSKGKFDFLPEIFKEIGIEKKFHKVAQRPGKPFWFGQIGNKIVFAFPGNPISTWACFKRYFEPWLRVSYGLSSDFKTGKCAAKYSFTKPLTLLQMVKESKVKGVYNFLKSNGSGDLTALTDADGFLELPAEANGFDTISNYKYIPF